MRIVDSCCCDIQKRVRKLLKKIFDIRSVADGMSERLRCRELVEKVIGKRLEEATWDDVKENKLCYEYSKYKTLDKILELYVGSVYLQKFAMKELEEYGR